MPIGAPLLLLPWGGAGAFPLGAAAVPGRDLAELSTRMDRHGSSPSTATAASSATRGSEELELAVVEYLGWFRHQHRKPTNAVSVQAGPAHSAFGGSREVQLADAARAARERTAGGRGRSGAAALLGGAALGDDAALHEREQQGDRRHHEHGCDGEDDEQCRERRA